MTENTILSLGAEGALLRIDVAYQGRLWHFDTSIVTGAHPWSGTINDVLTDRHLQDFATQLRSPDLPRTATLGGDRAAQVTLHISRQQGGTEGAVAITVEVARSGDDPYPFLRWLIFETPEDFGVRAATAIEEELLRAHRRRKSARS